MAHKEDILYQKPWLPPALHQMPGSLWVWG